MSGDLPSIHDLLAKDSDESSTREKLKSKIQEINQKRKEELVQKKAKIKNIPYIDLSGFAIGPEALKIVSLEDSKRYKIICFLLLEGNVRFGAVNPENAGVQKLVNATAKKIHASEELYAISERSHKLALKLYEHLPKLKRKIKGVKITENELKKFTSNVNNLKDFNKLLENINITDLVSLIIAAGVKLRASDIHIEPRETKLLIRFRIDGVLHDITNLDSEKTKLINSRIKLLSGLKLNVINRPQDGRFTIHLSKEDIDVRVSSLPTDFGETLTLRLLMASIANLKLEELGLNKKYLTLLTKQIKKPSGMIISTGPTGSGKTTTLYAIMNRLNDSETKIITIEDPIEYRLPNISQSQIDIEKGYTFAKGLKSIVRQDPDILMVGEIRDEDTTNIAIQASLTGHLILTTLHTNNALNAPGRLVSLGANPALLAPSLNLIIGQRLVRKLCTRCKKKAAPTSEQKKWLENIIGSWPNDSAITAPDIRKLIFYTAPGCDQCNGFGYWGRIGVFEVLIADKSIKSAVTEKKSAEHQLAELAQNQGMLTMGQDALLKAAESITSLDEIIRVTG